MSATRSNSTELENGQPCGGKDQDTSLKSSAAGQHSDSNAPEKTSLKANAGSKKSKGDSDSANASSAKPNSDHTNSDHTNSTRPSSSKSDTRKSNSSKSKKKKADGVASPAYPSGTATLIEKVDSLIKLQTRPQVESAQTQAELDRLCTEIEGWGRTTKRLDEKANQIYAELAQPVQPDLAGLERGLVREVQKQLAETSGEILQAIQLGFDSRLAAIDQRVELLADLLQDQSENVALTLTAVDGLTQPATGGKFEHQTLNESSLGQINALLQQSLQAQNLEIDEQVQLAEARFEGSIADTIEATIECKIDEKFQNLCKSVTNSLNERFSDFESMLRQVVSRRTMETKLTELETSISTTVQNELEKVELNLQSKVQQALSGHLERLDLTTYLKPIEAALTESFAGKFCQLEESVSQSVEVTQSLNATIESSLVNWAEHQSDSALLSAGSGGEVVDQIEQHQHHTNRLLEAVKARLEQVDAKVEGAREAIDQRIDKITTAIQGKQAILESQGLNSNETVSREFGDQIEAAAKASTQAIESLQAKFDELASRLENASLGQTTDDQEEHENDSFVIAPASGADQADHWHRQKEAMLSKYGIDPNYRPVMRLPNAKEKSETTIELEEAEIATLHSSLATPDISPEDAQTIESLKEEWTNKVRDAEIEVSINRAKLSRLKAELEERQVELDRRASALEQKYGSVKTSTPISQLSFFDRLKLHLGHNRKTGGRGE